MMLRLLFKSATALLTLTAVLVAVGLGVAHLAGIQPMAVLSGSMRPALEVGDLILVAPLRAGDAQVGQIVTFADPHNKARTLTHRVRSVSRDPDLPPGVLRFVTQGDANPAPERWVIQEDGRMGQLRARLPHAGQLAVLTYGSHSKALATVLFTLLGAGFVLWLIWRPKPGGDREES